MKIRVIKLINNEKENEHKKKIYKILISARSLNTNKSSHENKKALSPFYHKIFFLIVNKCKTSIGCLIFILCQK